MTSLKVTKMFFDREAVRKAMDRGTHAALSKIGAFLRTRARSGMRRRKKVADPGKPPSVHAGQLKDLLFFAYDPSANSVVIGPVPFRGGKAPHLLEFGGTVTRQEKTKLRTLVYRPHPFMKPALDAELAAGTIPRAWSNSISA